MQFDMHDVTKPLPHTRPTPPPPTKIYTNTNTHKRSSLPPWTGTEVNWRHVCSLWLVHNALLHMNERRWLSTLMYELADKHRHDIVIIKNSSVGTYPPFQLLTLTASSYNYAWTSLLSIVYVLYNGWMNWCGSKKYREVMVTIMWLSHRLTNLILYDLIQVTAHILCYVTRHPHPHCQVREQQLSVLIFKVILKYVVTYWRVMWK